ncbi:hypothetical protein [Janthinobacterium sp. 17J80-10]|uniref:hypothetical protein n=1 Tax=Janthinobacterium sp. 17J80-10 TaxID=2497863 RepID=UPI001005A8AC|nr:hypothetical protein [Janthinobacterium sp. 17J80-10]QAU33473.1 hypothetical protein EKL02_04335 [Janthinobacterium sp. 17J80-10]
MPLRYFKLDTLIPTSCENCGRQSMETLARLYSEARLFCPGCGQEHTVQRTDFRRTVEETEAAITNLPAWMARAISRLERWRAGGNSASPP